MSVALVGFGLALAALLSALAVIDARRMILPDWLNALLAATGCAQALTLGQPSPQEALVGGLVAGALLLAVAKGFRAVRGRDGLGLGDVKLAAAGAIWTGLPGIGPALLLAAGSCVATLACRAATRGLDPSEPFAFGPFLALGVFGAWLLVHAAV